MNFSEKDRDNLRDSQSKLQHSNVARPVGTIIEHSTQDPRQYRSVSSKIPKDVIIDKIDADYKCRYYDDSLKPTQQNVNSEEQSIIDKKLPPEVQDIHADLWMHMDKVEFDKLEWMTDQAQKEYEDLKSKSTRFDKNGRVMNKSVISDSDEGHDIESLVNLLDSTYPPQKSYALHVISKIADLTVIGYYDKAFDDNLQEILLNKYLLRVRHHIDDANETVCQGALKCLRSLICNTHLDEEFIDRMHPILTRCPDSTLWLSKEDDNFNSFPPDLKDSECAQIDAVLCLLLRTDLLRRFSYLLSSKLNYTYQECILDILIRLARHSKRVCLLLNKKDLLSSMINLFLPDIIPKDYHLLQLSVKALKLIRIISQAIRDLLIERKCELKLNISRDVIWPIVERHFFIDHCDLSTREGVKLCHLHIETMRLMKIFTSFRSYQDIVTSIMRLAYNNLFSSLQEFAKLDATRPLDNMISIRWQHVAHTLDLIGHYSKYEVMESTTTVATTLWRKSAQNIILTWLNDVLCSQDIPHIDVSIAINTGVYHLSQDPDDNLRSKLTDITSPLMASAFEPRCEYLKRLMIRTCELSGIANFLTSAGVLRDPKCLPSYGFLNLNTSNTHRVQVHPLFDKDSPAIMFDTLVYYLLPTCLRFPTVMEALINNSGASNYILKATSFIQQSTTFERLIHRSTVAQYEISIVSKILAMMIDHYMETLYTQSKEGDDERTFVAESINYIESFDNLVYRTISLISIIGRNTDRNVALRDELFENVLFSRKFHDKVSQESFMGISHKDHNHIQKDVTGNKNLLKLIDDDPLRILSALYSSYAPSDRFWLLHPILEYYEKHTKTQDEKEREPTERWFLENIQWRSSIHHVTNATDSCIMSLILAYNHSLMHWSPNLTKILIKPNIEQYLCIIGTLFLDDGLFLDETTSMSIKTTIKSALSDCLYSSTGSYVSLFKDASKIIDPLNITLADFFNKLIDQFEAASYGDRNFAIFITLFLTTDSDNIFKRILFQDKAETCLRMIEFGEDSLWAPKELYFDKKIKDPNILLLIKRSNVYKMQKSFLHHYYIHHTS